jgi:hypothetical protein
MNRASIWRRVSLARWTGTAAACSALLWASAAGAQPEPRQKSFTATGKAASGGADTSRGRSAALDDALAQALVAASGELLPRDVHSANGDLLLALLSENPRRWIQDYRILKEGKGDREIELTASVSPNWAGLRTRLTETGLLFERARRPVLAVRTLRERIPRKEAAVTASSTAWSRRLVARLKGLGYTAELLPPEREPDPNAADLAVAGTLSRYEGKAASFEFQLTSLKPREELGRVRGRFDLKDPDDRIAGLTASMVLGGALAGWARATGEGQSFEVTVAGLRSFSAYQEVRSFLNSGSGGFSSAREAAISKGTITFDVVFDGTLADLTRALRGLKLKGVTLRMADARERSVRLEAR